MNYDSFSHGQIKSKIWLCQVLEKYLPAEPKVTILGCWYNVLSFMLLTRNPDKYVSLTGIDIDSTVIDIADKVNNAFVVDGALVKNKLGDANAYDYSDSNLIINCSPEHMFSQKWFDNIPVGSVVCIQSSNVTDPNYPWLITNPSPTIESFKSKYMLTKTHFLGTLPIRYKNGQGYDRFMLIGIK